MSADETQTLLRSTSREFSTTILRSRSPVPSSSDVTFFVNLVSGFPGVAQCLCCPTFASHNSTLGNAQNCSCSIMMTNKDSLSHAACKRADTVFSNFTKPNFLSKLRHWLSPSSTTSPQFTRFPSLPLLILFVTCAAKRESQLSNGLSSAIRTPVLCSEEILKVLHCRFTSLTAISTRPLAMWSPSGGPCGVTSTPTHARITAS